MNKPNLFSYATSELSQDAVLCWLLAWAAPEATRRDPLLGRLGRALVEAMFAKHGEVAPEVHKIEVTRQYKNIDVLARISDELWLVIEDKVYTREHSDQLRRYLEVLDREREPHQTLLPIYVQTGEQSSHAAVMAAGFRVFGRSDFLAVLDASVEDGCRSEIVADFREHLQRIDREVKRFREGIARTWSGLTWQGFFGALQQRLGEGDWKYVANASGGFQGFNWHWRQEGDAYPFLQLEEACLCFKIYTPASEQSRDLMYEWRSRILNSAQRAGLDVRRPGRLRRGTTMTVAILGEYRKTDADGNLDLDGTVETLRQAERVLDDALRSGS